MACSTLDFNLTLNEYTLKKKLLARLTAIFAVGDGHGGELLLSGRHYRIIFVTGKVSSSGR
jgi:hypothetical protein